MPRPSRCVIIFALLLVTLMTSLRGITATARRICFLTDVEGNWQYMRQLVRQSTCLSFHDGGDDGELELRDDCVLVFGGDAGDKGDATLRCYEQLLRLKQRHPDRVVLLVGNRDVNKMRFTSELADSEMALDTMARDVRDGPSWVPQAKRTTLPQFLAQRAASDASIDADAVERVNTKVARLQYMLDHTMGAQGDFERRRHELLAARGSGTIDGVTDDDVLQSYVASVADGGVLREFLRHGSLAFVAHGVLFVHGGIVNGAGADGASTLGRVPGQIASTDGSISEWVDRLNAWYDAQVAEWIAHPTWNDDRTWRGGEELMKYVLPDYAHSVIMGRHLLPSGMPTPLHAMTAQRLSENRIRHLVIGHTPHGTCPTVIKQPASQRTGEQDFQGVVMCDTSYSDMTATDNRGGAASEVVVSPNGEIHVRGVLPNGHTIAFEVDDPLIGRMLRDNTVVKARLAECPRNNPLTSVETEDNTNQYVVVAVTNGFSYDYAYRSRAHIQEIGFADAQAPANDMQPILTQAHAACSSTFTLLLQPSSIIWSNILVLFTCLLLHDCGCPRANIRPAFQLGDNGTASPGNKTATHALALWLRPEDDDA